MKTISISECSPPGSPEAMTQLLNETLALPVLLDEREEVSAERGDKALTQHREETGHKHGQGNIYLYREERGH